MKADLDISNWFEEFHDGLFRFLVKLTGDYHESEDIIQDAYVRASIKLALFDAERGSVKNWVYKIAVNIYYDRERFRRKEEMAVDEYYRELRSEAMEEKEPDFEYSKEMINRAVMMLAPDKRAMFIMSLKAGVRDMAEIFSLAEGTVKSRMFYIRKELCANLRKIHEEGKL